jgi:hypothetical protein
MSGASEHSDGSDVSHDGAANSFQGTAKSEVQANRQALPNARNANARAVSGPHDADSVLIAQRLQCNAARSISGHHALALQVLVPVAAQASGVSLPLQNMLEQALSSPKAFHLAISKAEAVQREGEAEGGPLQGIAKELQEMLAQKGPLWAHLLGVLRDMTLSSTPGKGGRSQAEWLRILLVCEDSKIASVLPDCPSGLTIEAFLERIEYGRPSCDLDEESKWYARHCLRGEEVGGAGSFNVSASAKRKGVDKRRKTIQALGRSVQTLNANFQDVRSMALIIPRVGPLQVVHPATGKPVVPSEQFMPEVYSLP